MVKGLLHATSRVTRSATLVAFQDQSEAPMSEARPASDAAPADVVDAGTTVELLGRARHGDRVALEALFTRHGPRLRRWASGRLPSWARDMTDTDDLVQDAMMQ